MFARNVSTKSVSHNNMRMMWGMASKDSLSPDIYMIHGPTLKPFDVISSLREK